MSRTPAVQVFEEHEYDVVVIGGGTTGFAAAVSAARTGAKTALVEYNSFVGGNAANGLPVFGFHNHEHEMVVKGVALEYIQRLQSIGAATDFYFDPIISSMVGVNPGWLKVMAMKMLDECGVDLYLRSLMTDVELEGNIVRGIYIRNKQGRQLLRAGVCVDATDTADAAVSAGADSIWGDAENNSVQVSSYGIRVGGIDFGELLDYYTENPDQIRPFPLAEDKLHGLLGQMRKAPIFIIGGLSDLIRSALADGVEMPRRAMIGACFPPQGEATFVTSRVQDVDPGHVRNYTAAEKEGQFQVFGIMEFINRYMPGGRQARLIDTFHQIGIRETRHIVGDYMLTGEDVMSGCRFEDTVALGGYHVDIHRPDGDLEEFRQPPTYTIPYRSLLPKDVENLLVAGRCISATHEALASTRVIAISMAQGDAAGRAAGLAAKNGIKPRDLDYEHLREELIKSGAELGQGL